FSRKTRRAKGVFHFLNRRKKKKKLLLKVKLSLAMALERLALWSQVSFCVPFNPKASGCSPGSSLLTSSGSSFKPLRLNRRLKCSADYRDNGQNNQTEVVGYERPAEIPWKKELCNSVQLIGIVGGPVEIKYFPSGKVVAWTKLAFKQSATESCWINLTFWNEMAEIASRHIQNGNQIYVSGRLNADTVKSQEGKVQMYYKVVVQHFNFIERNESSFSSDGDESYINASVAKKFNNTSNMGSLEEQWQAFFASPTEWWDNRKTKRNPKYPDFKHKDTGESLWVENKYNPSWVKSQLTKLDERMASVQDDHDDAGSSRDLSQMGTDEYLSF
ncbi:Protein OSB1, mitochondrial, partial [Linum perenne]